MKKLTFILMLFTGLAQAQGNVEVAVMQDVKLFTIGDDKTGLDPLTLDVLVRVVLQGYQQKQGYMIVYPEFEYAKLKDYDYTRYTVNAGYIFNKLIVNKAELGLTGSFGMIDRFGKNYFTYGGSIELNYKLNNSFKIVSSSQLIKRGDLFREYGIKKFKPSFYLGIQYKL